MLSTPRPTCWPRSKPRWGGDDRAGEGGRAALVSPRPLGHARAWPKGARLFRRTASEDRSPPSISKARSRRSKCSSMRSRNPKPRARPARCSRLRPISRSSAISPSWWIATMAAEDVLRAAKGADRNLIEAANVFDVYEGKGVPEGKKSLAISVRLQPKDKTLTDAEIEAIAQKIVAAVTKATGGDVAHIRGDVDDEASISTRNPLSLSSSRSASSACSPIWPMKACAASPGRFSRCWARAGLRSASSRAQASLRVICCACSPARWPNARGPIGSSRCSVMSSRWRRCRCSRLPAHGGWPPLLIILERAGKAMRNPPPI